MPICNEDIATVFAGLRATCESVAATGALALFDFYVLSDSSRPEQRAAELAAWRKLRAELGDGALADEGAGADGETAGARLFYRWRRRRTRKKAGNVADFCRRFGSRYRYMVVLDADSTMQGDTLVALVRLMEQHPQAGIIQTLPQASGAETLHARVQQFASRVTGRLFALGMAYWQLGDSHYWGHNAILRVEPFMRHCGLAPLPGRGGLAGEILSHDFVEAALMRRAGFEVWLAPRLGGSWEQNPPHLLDELQRDRRWCQGNLQNARLLMEPGWQPAHRAMFAVGALSYLVAPLWLLFVLLGLAAGLAGTASSGLAAPAAGSGIAAWLWPLTLALLLLPRALGVAAVVAAGQARRYGGGRRLVASALLELAVASLQAPVRMLAHSHFVASALSGLKLAWRSPQRAAEAVPWREALGRIGTLVWPLALLLAALLAVMLPTRRVNPAHVAPLLLTMVLAAPLAWATAHPRLSHWLRMRGWLGTPEERAPPHALARAADRLGFSRLALRVTAPAIDAAATAVAMPAPARAAAPRSWLSRLAEAGAVPRWHGALATGLVAAAAAMVVPQPALSPEPSEAQRANAELAQEALLMAKLEALANSAQAAGAPPQAVRERPARMIDNAVRRRAREAVRRALEEEEATLDSRAPEVPTGEPARRA